MWKWEDNRVMSSSWFLTAKYAYYNTGFTLNSIGPATDQMGISAILRARRSARPTRNFNARPQHTVNVDSNYFKTWGDTTHDFKFGFGWRRTDIFSQHDLPGQRRRGLRELARPTSARRVYREGAGTNRAEYLNFYFGDTIALRSADPRPRRPLRPAGRQGAREPDGGQRRRSRPSCPGINFEGYEAPFTWNDITPRVGMTYALDEARKSIVRASFSRNAGQLTQVGVYIGYANPSSAAGWAEYPWVDRNGDHLAQTNEVLVNQPTSRLGRRLQHRQPDGGQLGQPDRSRLRRARSATASSSASIGS